MTLSAMRPDTALAAAAAPLAYADRLALAQQRLALSRAALRHAWIAPPEPEPEPEADRTAGQRSPWRLHPLWRRLRRATRQSAVASLLSHAARGWWQRHPWRPAGGLLLQQTLPLVQRHPWATVAVAAAAGAAVVALRPWRWPGLGQHLRPLPGRATHWLLGQLGSAPVQAALAGLVLMALRDTAPDGAEAAPPSTPPDSPPAPTGGPP